MSYIDDYLLITSNTKPPKEYHIWSMLSTLSTFAGRRFWFPFGHLNFFPNLYVVLVGDPSTGKSTAMNIAKEIVRASGVTPLSATQITKEALTLKMSSTVEGKPKKVAFEGRKFYTLDGRQIEYNQYAIYATELVEFIAVNPQGFLDFLTNAWDESVIEVETKNKGQDLVIGPYITMLACMTPEKLKGYLKMSILTGGFARRSCFMFCSNYNIIPWPVRPPQDAMDRCVQFGKDLQKRSGPFAITPECAAFYENWNTDNEKTIRDRPLSVRGWYSSKGEMLFKLSMLICLGNDADAPLVIDVPHYKMALHFCSLAEATLERVFEGTGINPNAGAIAQVVRMLEALGKPMNRKHVELMFMDNVTSLNELRDAINHLISCGRLVEKNVSSSGTLLGSVLGTPESMDGLSPDQLATYLKRVVVPPQGTDTGSSQGGCP